MRNGEGFWLCYLCHYLVNIDNTYSISKEKEFHSNVCTALVKLTTLAIQLLWRDNNYLDRQ